MTETGLREELINALPQMEEIAKELDEINWQQISQMAHDLVLNRGSLPEGGIRSVVEEAQKLFEKDLPPTKDPSESEEDFSFLKDSPAVLRRDRYAINTICGLCRNEVEPGESWRKSRNNEIVAHDDCLKEKYPDKKRTKVKIKAKRLTKEKSEQIASRASSRKIEPPARKTYMILPLEKAHEILEDKFKDKLFNCKQAMKALKVSETTALAKLNALCEANKATKHGALNSRKYSLNPLRKKVSTKTETIKISDSDIQVKEVKPKQVSTNGTAPVPFGYDSNQIPAQAMSWYKLGFKHAMEALELAQLARQAKEEA